MSQETKLKLMESYSLIRVFGLDYVNTERPIFYFFYKIRIRHHNIGLHII